jgi:hypothetical protein
VARTAAGDQLTAAYRGVLATRRANAIRDALALWPLLDFERLDQTYPGWETAARALIARDRALVVRDTHAYLTGLKAVDVGVLPASLEDADELAEELERTSLRVTSYVSYFRALGQTADPIRASRIAFVMSSGATTRLILNAARSSSINSVKADRHGYGWQRIAAAGACPFCTGLTGRVARVEASVDFPAHDHCLCSAEPIYR